MAQCSDCCKTPCECMTAAILTILYPSGIPVDRYSSALLTVRILDKLSREATTPDIENHKDICGYSLLGWHAALKEGGK